MSTPRSSTAPLHGVTVGEMCTTYSGSLCGTFLRWLGADVATLAEPAVAARGTSSASRARCDYVRQDKARVSEIGAHEWNRVLPSYDVVVTDLKPALLSSHGLHVDRWTSKAPNTVLVCISGFGLTGPRSGHAWSDLTAYHAGGEGFLLPADPVFSQYPDRPPVRGGRGLAEADTALTAAFAAVCGLIGRERRGVGGVVEVSAQEVEIGLNRTTLSKAMYLNEELDRSHRGYDYGGLLRCVDGWISLRPTEDAQWRSFALAIGREDLVDDERYATRPARDRNGEALTAELASWAGGLTRAEIRDLLIEAAVPGGPFMSPADLLADESVVSRRLFESVGDGEAPSRLFIGQRVPATTPRPGLRSDTDAGLLPLDGLNILDLTWVASGPYATQLLRFAGAHVIKVESRQRPDLFRRLVSPGDQEGLDGSIRFADLNQGKKSVELDLKNPTDRDALLQFIDRFDAVVDNFRPGVRERLGLGEDELRARNPSVTTVSLSGFGATGLYRSRPGYASVFNAESGIGHLTGYSDGPPTEIRDSNDLRAGTGAALAAVVGLFVGLRDGDGYCADVSAREILIALQGDAVLEASRGGSPHRTGNAFGIHVPHDCYRSGDGSWMAIAVRSDGEWRGFVEAVGDRRLEYLESCDAHARYGARELVDQVTAEWCAARSAHEIQDVLAEAGVPVAISQSGVALRHDPHIEARGLFNTVSHPVLGEFEVIGGPVRYWTPVSPQQAPPAPPPMLGQHTLSAELGPEACGR